MKKRYLAYLLSFAVILSLFSFSYASAEPSQNAGSQTLSEEYMQSFVVEEDISLREENAKHFLLESGAYTAAVYPESVHYQKGSQWVEIDNSLIPAVLIGDPLTGIVKRSTQKAQAELQKYQIKQNSSNAPFCSDYLENLDNPFKVQLPASINKDSPVIINYGDHALRFRFEDAMTTVAETRQPANEATLAQELQSKLSGVTDQAIRTDIQNDFATSVTKNRSSVSYASIQPGMDLNYYITGQKLKEDLVLYELPVAESFIFNFAYNNLSAVLEEDNSVTFYNEDGEAVFFVASPYMFDAKDDFNTAIAVTLEKTETGCRYILTPDREWLENPARVYPVTLDPTVSTTQNTNYIHDNGVQQSNPSTNYMTTNRIYVGSGASSTEGRMYFKLTKWPSVTGLTGANVARARMNLNYYPNASWQTAVGINIDVHSVTASWNTSTITWKSRTAIASSAMSSIYISDSRNKTSGFNTFDVTSWVRNHYNSPSTDYGIALRPRTIDSSKTNRACYISSDYYTNTALRPIINIDYVPRIAQERTNWCWAASIRMATGTAHTQAELATHVFGSAVNNGVSLAQLLEAANWARASGSAAFASQNSARTEAQIRTSINAGRPVIAVISWDGGGAHAIVLYGYMPVSGGFRYFIHDPWPVGTGASIVRTYAQITRYTSPATGAVGTWNMSVWR